MLFLLFQTGAIHLTLVEAALRGHQVRLARALAAERLQPCSRVAGRGESRPGCLELRGLARKPGAFRGDF